MYYLFSCISGSLEIGIIFGGIKEGFPLWKVLIFGLAYQLGNLVPIPYTMHQRERKIGVIILAVLWGIRYSSCEEDVDWMCLVGIIVILSGLIQSIRADIPFYGEKWKKRFFRVVGFGTAVFYGWNMEVSVAIVSITMVLTEISRKNIAVQEKSFVSDNKCLDRTMIFHQMHYFVYAYAMINLACNQLTHSLYSILFFVFSWLTYLMTEPLLKRFGHGKWFRYLVTGHMVLAISLFLAAVAAMHANFWLFFIWVLSGFGGGTVFCIKLVEEAKVGKSGAVNWTLSENLGHILGCLIACIWTALGMETALLLVVGASFALLTILSASVGRTMKPNGDLLRRKRYEHI